MKLHLPISSTCHLTIISTYSPTLTSSYEDEKFYEDVDRLVGSTPKSDIFNLLGDFNAKVGSNSQCWEWVMNPHGAGKMNSNRLLLVSICAENDLTITNTLFRLANKYKKMWMHPWPKEWLQVGNL